MNTTVSNISTGATIRSSSKAVALFAIAAGLAVVFLTAFAGSATLHNAAHDTRHSMSFPCH